MINRTQISMDMPVAPVIWPLVKIAGDHMNQSDEHDRPDEGGAVAVPIIEAFPGATPTDAREVGALLLALYNRVEDLAAVAYERSPRPGVSDEHTEKASRIAEALHYSLARAAAVLWQADGWTDASYRVFAHFTTIEDRRKIHADLIAAGLPGLPNLSGDGEGGAA